MKQQMLEAEIVELNATIESLKKEIAEMHEKFATDYPTVGKGPCGASVDREQANGKPNGFVRPASYFSPGLGQTFSLGFAHQMEPPTLFSDWDYQSPAPEANAA